MLFFQHFHNVFDNAIFYNILPVGLPFFRGAAGSPAEGWGDAAAVGGTI